MKEEEIRKLYNRLIEHYAECHALPKLTRWKPSFVILDKDDKKSQFFEKTGNVSGAWSPSDWDLAHIEFYGEPDIETVMHELIHHIIFVIDRVDEAIEENLWKPENLITRTGGEKKQ